MNRRITLPLDFPDRPLWWRSWAFTTPEFEDPGAAGDD
jgi:hypothetical protein